MKTIVATIVLVLFLCSTADAAGGRPIRSSRPDDGTVSNGNCRCKTLCEVHQAAFSPGHTIAQCRGMCEQAFAGCVAGGIRSRFPRHGG